MMADVSPSRSSTRFGKPSGGPSPLRRHLSASRTAPPARRAAAVAAVAEEGGATTILFLDLDVFSQYIYIYARHIICMIL